MEERIWLKVLQAVEKQIDPNLNIIETIKQKLKSADVKTYEDWEKAKFDINYCFGYESEEDGDCAHTLLNLFAKYGHLSTVRALNDNGADVNAANAFQSTSLLLAISNRHTEIVKFLVDIGADVNLKNKCAENSLHLAVETCDLDTIKYLIDNNADVMATDIDDETPLHIAVRYNRIDIVKFFIDEIGIESNQSLIAIATVDDICLDILKYLIDKKNIEFNIYDKGWSPLYLAAHYGNLDIVKYFIEDKNISVMDSNEERWTPLYLANTNRSKNNVHIVKYLVEKGADVNALTIKNRSPVQAAACSGNFEVIKYLVEEKGADIHNKDIHGLTAMLTAVEKGHFEIAKYFIENKKCDVSLTGKNNRTILHLAVHSGNLDMVKYLVDQKGAKSYINVKRTDNAWTCLREATSKGYSNIIEFLITKGAKYVNYGTTGTFTEFPLHNAAARGDLNKVQILVKSSSNLNLSDFNGHTPLQYATKNGHLNVVEFLVKIGANVGIRDIHYAVMKNCLDTIKFFIDEICFDYNQSLINVEPEDGNKLTTKKYSIVDEKNTEFNVYSKGWSPLYLAAHYGNLKIVKYLIESKNFSVMERNKEGWTPLYMANTNKDKDNLHVIKYLVEKGADINTLTIKNRSPVQAAAFSGSFEAIEYLVEEKGADIYNKDIYHQNAMMTAVENGHFEIVKYFIENKECDVSLKDINERTILHLAVHSGNLDIVKYLVDQKVPKSYIDLRRTDNGWTCLHEAIARSAKRYSVITELLITNGANVNIGDVSGNFPIHKAAAKGDLNIVQLLVKNQSNLDPGDVNGQTPLHRAAKNGHLNVVKFLVEIGASVNIKDLNNEYARDVAIKSNRGDVVVYLNEIVKHVPTQDEHEPTVGTCHSQDVSVLKDLGTAVDINKITLKNRTPVQSAAFSGSMDVIKYLVEERGANLHTKDIYDHTAMLTAVERGHFELVKYFIENKECDISLKDIGDRTILHLAVHSGNLNMVKYLVEQKGAESYINFKRTDNGWTCLHEATAKGYCDITEFLISKGANLNIGDKYGNFPIHKAAARGDLNTVELLIKYRSYVKPAGNGEMPLHRAAKNGHLNVVKYFVKIGASVGIRDLHCAIISNCLDMVKFFLEELGFDFNQKLTNGARDVANDNRLNIRKWIIIDEKNTEFNVYSEGWRPLYLAAHYGSLNIVKYLIEDNNVSVTERNEEGWTPLYITNTNKGKDNLHVVKYLLEKGADINTLTIKNRSPVQAAAFSGSFEVIKYLVEEKGADIHNKDMYGLTAMLTAVEKGHFEIAKYFIENQKCDVSLKDRNNRTILHLAVHSGNLDMVKYLVDQKGAESYINIKRTDNSWTCLHEATVKGYSNISEFLITKGATVNIGDIFGHYPIHKAAAKGDLNIVQLLVNSCSNVNPRDFNGQTPLHCAARNGYLNIVKFLVEVGASVSIRDVHNKYARDVAITTNQEDVVLYLNEVKHELSVGLYRSQNVRVSNIDRRAQYESIERYLS